MKEEKLLSGSDLTSMFSSIYFELQKDINNISKTLELVEENLKKLENSRSKNDVATEQLSKDLNNSFSKLRDILDMLKEHKLDKLYEDIVDMNNTSSLNNRLVKLFDEQNKSLTDLNNSKSVVSLLKENYASTMSEVKKSNNFRTTITWIIVTVGAVLNIYFKYIKPS